MYPGVVMKEWVMTKNANIMGNHEGIREITSMGHAQKNTESSE